MKRKIKNIVIHCTAGHKNAKSVQSFFTRPKSKGGRGWRTGGYHIIIEKDGTIVQIYSFDKITNGVKGHNKDTIHIAYVGGVDKNDLRKAKDTRTPQQKKSIEKSIKKALDYCKDEEVGVVGHRDYSNDKNGNNVIEPWERIKECPSFDAIKEYSNKYASSSKKGKLPK